MTARCLAICPSAPHRAVIGLLRAALAAPVPAALIADLAASDPHDLAEIAIVNFVHTVLGSAFDRQPDLRRHVPRDLEIFFHEMQRANLQRNALARQQLRWIGTVLNAENIAVVVLKGGAELVSPTYENPSHRFISDLDLLVAADRIEAAAALLRAQGGRAGAAHPVEAGTHHHPAPLAFADWPLPVELHRRVGGADVTALLDPAAVIARSRASTLPGIRLPSPPDRFIHHVAHTQFSPARFRAREISLRSIADHAVLRQQGDGTPLAEASRRFALADRAPALAALDAVTDLLLGVVAPADPVAGRWTRTALHRFGRPGLRRRRDSLRWLAGYISRFIREPARRRHYLAVLSRAEGWRQLAAFHRDRLARFR